MRRQTGLRRVGSALVVVTVGCTTPATEAPAEGEWGYATVVEELSIGVDVGAEEYMLGAVREIAVARDGRIFVWQLSPRAIREYDAEGNFAREIGREGQGPGEYQSPSLAVLDDGRLAVWDFRSDRLSLFDRDGLYQGAVRAESRIGGSGTLLLDVDGSFLVRAWTAFETPPTSEAEIPVELRRYSLEGELLDTLATPTRDPAGANFMVREGFQSFTVETLWAWSRLGYLVAGRNDLYDIELRTPSGTVHVGRDVAPVPLAGEEREEWEAFRTRTIEINADLDLDVEPLPNHKPFFRELRTGDDGRIWVYRYAAADKRTDIEPIPGLPDRPLLTWREPASFDVFEPDGTFLGSMTLTHDFQPLAFRGEHIWGAHVDADGVERVVRLRVVPGGTQ